VNDQSDSASPDDQTRPNPLPPAFPNVRGAGSEPAEPTVTQSSPFAQSVTSEPQAPSEPPVATTEPVAAAPRRGSTLRWLVAAVATVFVVAVVAAVIVLAGPRIGTASVVAHFAPADSSAYMEARLDLPGDQRDRLVSFMSHFPGFADPANFQTKLDDTLNQILKSSGSGLDWQNDVDPWFGGQIAVFSSNLGPTISAPPAFTAALSVKDRTRLDQLVADRMTQAGATQQDYQGQTIWTVSASGENTPVYVSVTNDALLVSSSVASIESALDVKAGKAPSLADDAFYTQQLGSLDADRLATIYYDGSRLVSPPMVGPLGSLLPDLSGMNGFTAMSAVKVVGELRAEGDHLAFVVRSQRPANADLPALPANRHTTIAESMPADTLFYGEVRDVGADIKFVVNKLLTAAPAPAPSGAGAGAPFDLNSISTLLGVAPADFLDFVQDVGVSVTYTDGQVGAGLIATVDDENVARTRVERLLTTLRGLAAFGGGITIVDQSHGNATITVVTISGSSLLSGSSTSGPPVSLSVSVANGHLLIGLGDFVANALDRTAADSLAGNPKFKAALDQAAIDNAGFFYVDVAAARAALEPLIPATDRAHYDQDIKPFLGPFNDILIVHTTDGSTSVGHGFLFVK
jgi:hypothetical protein